MQEVTRLAAELALDLPADFAESIERELRYDTCYGLSADRLAEPARPTAALTDVRRVAEDFMILRTMPRGLGEMLAYFDFDSVLHGGWRPRIVAMIQSPRGAVLGFFDDDYNVQMEAVVDASAGFIRRAGVELPAAGLRVLSIAGRDVSDEQLRIPLK